MGSDDETILGDDSGSGGNGELKPGTMLDNYRIERLLGRGGMGAVYLAEHERLKQHYALKVLPQELSGRGDFAERFLNEGQRMAALRHPGIVSILNAGESAGLHFFAMEYVSGGDLEQRLEAAGGRLPQEEVRSILQQLLEGLQYAHGEGVIHRDLKPANILVEGGEGADVRVKITDFGLAEVLGEGYMKSLVERTMTASMLEGAETLMESGSGSQGSSQLAGTIHYMAPEVLQREAASAQSDLYAVGVIGYHLLTGRKPLGRYKDASRLVEGLDSGWDDFLNGLMEPDPEDRIQTAEAALAVLPEEQDKAPEVEAPPKVAVSQVADKKPVFPEPSTSKATAESGTSGGKSLWIALAVVLLLVGGTGGWAFGVYLPQERTFEEMRERIAALPLTAEPRAVERLDEAVGAFITGAPDRHIEPIEGAWAMRRDEIEMRREAFASLTEEIEALPTNAPMAELEALDEVVDGYVRQAPEAHRDRIASEWEQRRAAIESYWENARGGLILDTEPSGAEVRIGGLSIEESPVRLSDLHLGGYAIDIVHPDYERWSGVAEVEDGRFTDLGTIELQRSTGGLRVSANSEAIQWTLEKADAEVESLEGTGAALLEHLPTGDYILEAQRDGWPEQVHEFTIARNEVAELELEFPFGSLRLTSEPSGAEVWVGGEHIGVTPYQIGELPPGNLRDFEIRKEGYFEQTASGRIKAGEEQVLAVELVEGFSPSQGENYTVHLDGGKELNLTWIEPGRFVMGSPSGESGRWGDEGPQTTVRLTRGYWLGKTPVTQGQWQALMGNNPSSFKQSGLNAPVERVSWEEAMEYCRRLTERERSAGRLPDGYAYTLPSEAQWEYAARAGTTTRWSFGESENSLGDYAWYSANSGNQTRPVAAKRANAWGLYDVHGNVWEWTRSWWQNNHPGGSVVDYEGPASGTSRVSRGGSWLNSAAGTRSASRGRGSPGSRSSNLGFRLALSSVQ